MAFTKKQREFLDNANHRWNIKVGATRSGKTYLDYFVIPKRIRRVAGLPGLVVILGNTKGTLQRNIIEPLQTMHTNAGGGHGCEVYTYSGATRELKYAEPIYNEIAGITPYSDRGLKVAQFAELVQTTAIAVYCECAFHDNYDEAKWIVENVENIGKAIAKGMCKAVGKTFSEGTPEPAPAPEPSGETVYTVQSGDTLWGIGQKYGVEYQAIADYNGITNPSLIYPGQKIKIPGTGTTLKSIDEVAREVIRGLGNGAERFARLEAAGYNSDAVQARVNEMLS